MMHGALSYSIVSRDLYVLSKKTLVYVKWIQSREKAGGFLK